MLFAIIWGTQGRLRILFLGCAVLGFGACEAGDDMEAQAWEDFEVAQEQRELLERSPEALETLRLPKDREPKEPSGSTYKSSGYLGSCTAGPAGPFVPIHSVSCQCKQLTRSCEDDSCGTCSTPKETSCASTSYLRHASPFYMGCRISDLDCSEDFCAGAGACQSGCSDQEESVTATSIETTSVEVGR